MRQSTKPDFDTAHAHGDDKPTVQIKKVKASYAVPCSSKFREAVLALADKRGVNVADLARAILLSFPRLIIEKNPDPGGPEPNDREVIILQSGPSQGNLGKESPVCKCACHLDIPPPSCAKHLILPYALIAAFSTRFCLTRQAQHRLR